MLWGRYHPCIDISTRQPSLAVNAFLPLSSLPSGLNAPSAHWKHVHAAANTAGSAPNDDAAAGMFGFNGPSQAARVLSVPSASGNGAAQLEARFLNCLFDTRSGG
ncbi:MAG: hypothetical protein LBE78_14180 [Burkholderiaceae bacterium]|jgi:hypothetical protein|nr:hypothetical protein [Burkholderiaceae bacterium]